MAAGPAAGTVSEASIDQLSGASIDQQSPAMRAPASTCARQHRYAGASIDQLSRYHTTQYSAVSRRSDAACACPDHVHLSLSYPRRTMHLLCISPRRMRVTKVAVQPGILVQCDHMSTGTSASSKSWLRPPHPPGATGLLDGSELTCWGFSGAHVQIEWLK